MSQKQSRGRRVFVYAAASYLGYKVPAEGPIRGDERSKEKAYRAIRTFYQAIVEGRAPAADGKESSRNWWYQETLDAWIAKSSNAHRRGRKPKSEVADAA